MPANYRIDEELGVVFGTFAGTVTLSDLIEAQRALMADPRFRPHLSLLLDTRDAADVRLSAEDVRTLSRSTALGPGARRAIVATTDLRFGLARMYEMLSAGRPDQTAVFRTIEDALDWLREGRAKQ